MISRKQPMRKQKAPLPTLIVLSILVPALILSVAISQRQTQYKQQAAGNTGQYNHTFAAFSAGTTPTIDASVGLNAILDYGYNPVVGDSKSTALKTSNLQIIDQMPDEYLRQYDKDGNLQALTTSITNHLKSVQNNSQIIAYWVLDDWSHDGTAKTALQQMNTLIHQYTPGKPSICGFSGNSGNYAGKTQNFSPTGCDMVGLYIYPQSAAEFSLPTILPALEAGLKAQGWDINNNPLVGVPLSYGGANGYAVPTAQEVETETKAFCQAGASNIIYYDFGTGTNGSNDSGIQQGIKAGISDCKSIWATSTNPGSSGSSSSQPAPTDIVPSFVCAGGINCAGTPNPTIFGGTTPVPSSTITAVPVPTNTVSIAPNSTITLMPSSDPNQNPVISSSPITGGNDQSLINKLLNLIKKIIQLLQQLSGGSNRSHRHHHHHD